MPTEGGDPDSCLPFADCPVPGSAQQVGALCGPGELGPLSWVPSGSPRGGSIPGLPQLLVAAAASLQSLPRSQGLLFSLCDCIQGPQG